MTDDYSKQFIYESEASFYTTLYDGKVSYDMVLWDIEKKILDKLLNKYAGYTSDKSLLDFACGTGRITSYLEGRFQTAVGVDISEAMAKVFRARVKNAKIVVGNFVENPDLVSGTFDVITAFRFFLNAEPELRERVLEAIRSHMSDDSILIVNNHGRSPSFRSLLMHANAALRRKPKSEMNEMSDKEFSFLLYRTGFHVVERTGIGLLSSNTGLLLGRKFAQILEFLAYRIGFSSTVGNDMIYVLKKR